MKQIIINVNDKKEMTKYLNEINVFKKLDNPNLIKYSHSFYHKNKLCIVMEYAEKGDLSNIISHYQEEKKFIPEKEIWSYFMQLVKGIHYLHSMKVIHRDIKCQNIFIGKGNVLKLGDFGISKILENTYDFCNTPLGTPYFLSPEICRGEKYDYKSDIWMLGCVLYELMTLRKPFEGNSLTNLVQSIVTKDPPEVPKHYSQDLRWLVKKLLSKDVNERPYINEVFNYKCVRNKEVQKHFESKSTIDDDDVNDSNDELIMDERQVLNKIKVSKNPLILTKTLHSHSQKQDQCPTSDESSFDFDLINEEYLPTLKDELNPRTSLKKKEIRANFLAGKNEIAKVIKQRAPSFSKGTGKTIDNDVQCSRKNVRHASVANIDVGPIKRELKCNVHYCKYNFSERKRMKSSHTFEQEKKLQKPLKKKNSGFSQLKNTPKKYLISFESDSPDLSNFRIESEEEI